jgi:hypothetical protein
VGGLSHADRAGRALKGGLSPRRPCPVFSPVQGKARGQAGPCPGGEGPPPGEPPEEPGGPPEEGGSSARGAAASGFGGPDLRVVRPAVVVEDAKKRASIALFRDSSARRRAGLISPGRRRESVSIPPWGFLGRSGEGAGGVCLPLLERRGGAHPPSGAPLPRSPSGEGSSGGLAPREVRGDSSPPSFPAEKAWGGHCLLCESAGAQGRRRTPGRGRTCRRGPRLPPGRIQDPWGS